MTEDAITVLAAVGGITTITATLASIHESSRAKLWTVLAGVLVIVVSFGWLRAFPEKEQFRYSLAPLFNSEQSDTACFGQRDGASLLHGYERQPLLLGYRPV